MNCIFFLHRTSNAHAPMSSMKCSEFKSHVEQHARPVDPSPPGWPQTSQVHPTDVLAELSVLLEEYAPTWYSERLRHRILTALRLPTEVLVEACALLEDHAPTWYTDQQRGRALGTLQALGLLQSERSVESDNTTG
jgi:hypothetical protein